MNRYGRYLLLLLATAPAAGLICVLCLGASGSVVAVNEAAAVGRPAQIHPDYADTVIPPNIAPLNFLVRESGSRYLVRIRSQRGRPIEVASWSGRIAIPERAWHELLDLNRGGQLAFEVFVQSSVTGSDAKGESRSWRRFDAFGCTIANEDIDNYLAYRKIQPVHSAWRDMGIYQRDLRSFHESIILSNEYFGGGCVNCHTFCNNRADTMLISTRSKQYTNAAVIIHDGTVDKVAATFGYSAWHPSGKIVVFSSAKISMFMHAAGSEVRDVIDLDSFLAYYDVSSKTLKTAPEIAKKERLETYPTWSPDGRFLYFCSAPLMWTDRNVIPDQYDRVRYDLVRIAYDPDRDAWGPLETVLSAQDTGQSILLPRISPDGRWLLFCMCKYGCFPVSQQSSDLYMIDLDAAKRTGRYEYRRLEVNSDQSESWHSWSSNSRWIAFSSKRGNGTFTRTYISYVDENGAAHKPLLLPQKDPTHYDSCLWTYSVPELATGPVKITKENLGRVVRGSRRIDLQMPFTMATPKAKPDAGASEPYQSIRE
jgi:hypothetical protein